MKQQDNNPLDELFASLAEPKAEAPTAAFLQDVEVRLDALAQKRRKPLAIWWIWSAFGALLTFGSVLFWQVTQDETVHSSTRQVARKTQRVSRVNTTSITTSPHSNYSISSSTTPTVFSLSPSEVASITNPYSISVSDLNFSAPSIMAIIPKTTKTEKQDRTDTNTSIIDTNENSKAKQQPVIESISAHPKESAKPTKKSQSLGLQFGVSGIFSSFEVPSGSSAFVQPFTPKELREWRELGERQTSSWDFNLRYQLFFGQWGLQTGLSYLEWGEQYTYKVISVEGTNRYQYVQIPLGLSYQIPLRKVLLQPSVGIGLGYGVRRDGAYILPYNNGVAVVESKKWAANAYLQFELVYQVNAQLQFSLAPMFRYSLGRIVNDEIIMNRYQSLGLLTGFSFAF
jgi:hypothetical protein